MTTTLSLEKLVSLLTELFMSLCQNRVTPLLPLMYLGVHVHVITSSSTEDEESTQKSLWIKDRLYEWSQWSDIASKSRVSSNLYTKSILVVLIPLTLKQPTYPYMYIMINHHTWVDKGVGMVVGLPTLRSAINRRMWLLTGFLASRVPFFVKRWLDVMGHRQILAQTLQSPYPLNGSAQYCEMVGLRIETKWENYPFQLWMGVSLKLRFVIARRDSWSFQRSSPAIGQDCSSLVRVSGAAITVNHHLEAPLGFLLTLLTTCNDSGDSSWSISLIADLTVSTEAHVVKWVPQITL